METPKQSPDEPLWSLPLSLRPRVDAVGVSSVGILPEERYLPMPSWQIGLFEGETAVELTRGKRTWQWPVGPRTVLVIPPRSTRVYSTPRRVMHYYAAFRFPRGGGRTESPSDLAPVIPLGIEAALTERDFSAAIDLRVSDRDESDLLIWLILRRLARLTRETRSGRATSATVVKCAMERIRRHLADADLTPEALAGEAGLSRRRLDQLFTEAIGCPVAAWIREQRLARATRLLEETSIPIGVVGEVTGLGDPHQFNKSIRRATGLSPTEVRRGACPCRGRQATRRHSRRASGKR